jgi:parallel beta-helix repeat protein
MKKIVISVLLSFFFLISTHVYGDTWTTPVISENTTWYKNNTSGDGVYIIDLLNDTLIVSPGIVLTIEPGVTVKFHDDIQFFVYGTLTAEGTESDSIIFTLDDQTGSAEEWGGIKLLADSTSNKLIYCRIEYGDADIYGGEAPDDAKNGGAVFCGHNINDSTEIKHCLIRNNKAYEGGGGIFCSGASSPVIDNNIIKGNSAGYYGGGIGVKGAGLGVFSSPSIINNIIIENKADVQGGGGIGFLSSSIVTAYNNLIYKNESPSGTGGGLFIFSSSTNLVNITNSVVWGNTANSDEQIHGVFNVTYSDIEDSYSGEGNIASDPAFNDPANYDFHFEANSPLVDGGTNSDAPAVDFDGVSRPFDGDRDDEATVDIGPYEYINTAPVITSSPVTTAVEDELYTYTVIADDPDAEEVLTFSLLEAPGFLSIDGLTGEISGTPATDDDAGDHTVRVQVADLNNAADTQLYTLTVSAVNDTPIVSDIPNQTIAEGGIFTTIALDDYVDDEESADSEINWSYSGNTELTVSIASNHIATISMPNEDWYGGETITFTATDPGGLSDSDPAIFTVTNVNDAPVVSQIPNQEIQEGAAFATINLDNYVDDIDNADSEITWTTSGNVELSVSIDTNRVATITPPDLDWNGTETIVFKATDPGSLSDSTSASFTVTPVNDAPVVSGIPDQTIVEGGSFLSITLDDYVDDVDNADSEMTWTYSGNVDLIVTIAANRVATVAPPHEDWFGNETIIFTAEDPDGLADSDSAIFTVTNVNDAPVAVDDSAETDEDTQVIISVLSNDIDVDNDPLTVQSVTSPLHGTAVIYQDTAVTYTPNADYFGADSFSYTMIDGNGGSAEAVVTVTVTAMNDAPVVSDIPNQTIQEESAFTTISLDNYVEDVDNADNEMTWTYSGNTELTVTIDGNRIAAIGLPSSDWNGSETITFTATDPGSLSDSDSAVFTVMGSNDAPVVSGIPDQSIVEGSAFTIINLDNYVEDIDNADSEMTWTYAGSVELIVTIDTTNRTATITPPNPDWNGSENIIFTAADPGALSDSDTASFTITAVNDAPVVSGLPALSFNEDDSLVYNVANWYPYVEDADNADSTLTYNVSSGKNVSAVSGLGVYVFKAAANWFGNDTLQLIVSDGELADSADFIVTVKPVNDAPQIVDLPESVEFSNDSSAVLIMNDYAVDIDTPDSLLFWIFETNNDSLVLHYDSSSTQLTLTAPGFSGDVELICAVTDDSSASAIDTIIVKVGKITGIDHGLANTIPATYKLYQNYPNPFNPKTNIKFDLPKSGKVKIIVYNILGQSVATLFDGYKPAGSHTVKFNAANLSSGLYFYQIQTKGYNKIRKMILMK